MGIGNITRDPEVRQVAQTQVAKFGLAMNEKYRKPDGTIGENTEFIDVELWNQSSIFQYLTKGQLIYVEGSLKTDKWVDKDGYNRTTTKVKAFTVKLLGPRPQTQSAPSPAPAPQYHQAPNNTPYQRPTPPPAPPAPQPDSFFSTSSDDLPF